MLEKWAYRFAPDENPGRKGTPMATEFDSQLIESVTVRRNRLSDALLYGANPTERRWKSTARSFIFSVVTAALIAAICVGVAFVGNLMANQQRQQQEREQKLNSAPLYRPDAPFTTEQRGI